MAIVSGLAAFDKLIGAGSDFILVVNDVAFNRPPFISLRHFHEFITSCLAAESAGLAHGRNQEEARLVDEGWWAHAGVAFFLTRDRPAEVLRHRSPEHTHLVNQ